MNTPHKFFISTRLFAHAWLALLSLSKARASRVKTTYILASQPPAFIHGIEIDRAITLRLPTRWLGALRPRDTYREKQAFHFGFFSTALNNHMMFMGTIGIAKSIFASPMPFAPMRPARAPADYLADLEPWDIGADEPLNERHPLIACAFLQRARMSEESHGIFGEPERAILDILSDAMAGRHRRDGLHPDFANGLERSSWAKSHIPHLLESAIALSRVKRERDEILEASPAGQIQGTSERKTFRI